MEQGVEELLFSWWLVGNQGIQSLYTMLPSSLLTNNKVLLLIIAKTMVKHSGHGHVSRPTKLRTGLLGYIVLQLDTEL